MKKVFYSGVIIAYTIFISGVLINLSKSYHVYNENSMIAKELEQEIYKEKNHKEENIDSEVNDDTNFKKYMKFKENQMLRMEEQFEYNDKYMNDNYNSYIPETDYKIIKTSVEDIEKDLSMIEKAKLMIISEDLSNRDIEKISEYIEYKNEKIGVEKIIEIVKEKLKPKDVEYVFKVFSRYIDFSSLR